MVNYNLNHLTQPEHQRVLGPIQDDEALFLYSIIKSMRLDRILEIGGGSGYSAQNFLASMDQVSGTLYTVDFNYVPKLAENHKVITKNALLLTTEDVDNQPIDFVFFDCHDIVQLEIYNTFIKQGIINDNTCIALHDTNLHYAPYNVWGEYISEEDGFAHQPVEREMVRIFKNLGYDAFCLHTTKEKHNDSFPFRHGVTICKKHKHLF